MAYIQFHQTHVQEYHNSEYMPDDYRITDITDEGVAQTTADVADTLVSAEIADHYDTEDT